MLYGDYGEDYETMVPFQMPIMAGHAVDAVRPDRKAGQKILTAVGVLKGRSLSAYPPVGPEVTLAGGTYVDIGMTEAHVDGDLVTAPAWPARPAWMAAFLERLVTVIEP